MIQMFNINNYVIDTSKFDHVLHSAEVTEFEKEFAHYVGAKYACSVNSATSAIFLIFLQKNIVVNVPSIIPPVVLNAIINGGNRINFIDNISWVGDSYVLHNFGDYKVIDSAQKVEKNQFKIEADSEDLIIYSFYPTKPVGGLDGGMIVSDDYQKICYYKQAVLNGMHYANNNWNRKIVFPGWKMYMNSFQASVARQNFYKLSEKMKRLSEIRSIYNNKLGYANTSGHLYRINVKDNQHAIEHMRDRGVTCGIHYGAAHMNPVYSKSALKLDSKCPLSERMHKTTLSIPFHEKMSNLDVEKVIHDITQYNTEGEIT